MKGNSFFLLGLAVSKVVVKYVIVDLKKSRNIKFVFINEFAKFQFICDVCGQAFHNKRRLRSHEAMCVFCDKCQRYMDKRHVKTCKGKVFKLKRVKCEKCKRFMTKSNMRRHMKGVHKEEWSASDHPDLQTEVSTLIEIENIVLSSENVIY